ncbi:hypothetical protein LSCM1_03670 [Leishmania martiniquensis]|uniref:Uncharacterized protein n=1 Tax=Leishmania martiniquensis TaxID=1580590 RepID=A0A836H785_9TRYP|nr:hypothetical protein LSCM1_03670 [Leishmania martiniquensis]
MTMPNASQRAAQQRRIQQLHERLELYNITDSHADPISTTAGDFALPGAGGPQSGSGGKAPASKPSRAAPVFSSPNLRLTSASAPNAFSATSLPPRTTATGVPSFTVGLQRGSGNGRGATAASPGTKKGEGSRTSPAPQQQPQANMPAPAPAPQLARNLTQEFVGSAASPTRASPTKATSRFAAMASGSAASPVAAGRLTASTTCAGPATETAETANSGSVQHSSNAFQYREDAKADRSEYDEYEVEEYTEDDDYEGDDEEPLSGKAALTLEDMLQRLHQACSGASDHATASSPLQQAMAAASRAASASSPLDRDPSSASATQATAAAPCGAPTGSTTNPTGAAHPFLQQAAEVYRQRYLRKAAQEQQHYRSPFDTGHAWSSDEETSMTDTSTSEPTGQLDDASESQSASGASSAEVILKGHVDAATVTATVENGGSSEAARDSLAATTTATRAAVDDASAGNALPSSAVCFDQLEAAYRRLLILQEGAKYVSDRAGPGRFPRPLPRQDNARALAEQRDMVVKRDAEMRAAPPAGASLEDLRQRENAAIEKTLASLREKFDVAMKSLRSVADREALVEGKRTLLKQRELDIAKQREARLIVEREVAVAEQRLIERAEQLRRREEDYNGRLQQHDQQQQVAQEHIGEVEQLSKQVSSWLAILEERDRRLTRKEKRLQQVQADLLKRTEDVTVWKRATQRIKQIPPPPSPPRIS